jgi:hypothetical protein
MIKAPITLICDVCARQESKMIEYPFSHSIDTVFLPTSIYQFLEKPWQTVDKYLDKVTHNNYMFHKRWDTKSIIVCSDICLGKVLKDNEEKGNP